MPVKSIRLSVAMNTAVEKELERLGGGTSFSDWGTQAIQHYLECPKTAPPTAEMRLIVLKYPATCIKCEQQIPAQSHAFWGRGVGALCLDCYVTRLGDKTILAKDLKLRKLKRLIKLYTEEKERLADEVEGLKLGERVKEMHVQTGQLSRLVNQYFKAVPAGTAEERLKLEELMRLVSKQFETLRDVQAFIEVQVGSKLRKHKASGVV